MKTVVASISFTCGALITVCTFVAGMVVGVALEQRWSAKEEKEAKVVNIENGMK